MSESDRASSEEFLLRCLSVGRPPSSVIRYPSTTGGEPVNWNMVTAIAADHGIAPLLYKRLEESAAQVPVPADVCQGLRRVYVASAVRNMSFLGTLRKVLQRLRSTGISVIVLKGSYLAGAVYGDDALRPMVDVDLMVPRADMLRACSLLLEMGQSHLQLTDVQSHCRKRHHLPAVVINNRVGIELHWNIVPPVGPVRIDAAGLWERACPAVMGGVEVLALSPVDLLLHLCVHASYSDGFRSGLRSIYDVSATVQRFRGDMNWSLVVERAREWRATRHVGRTLDLAHNMLGTEIPTGVVGRLAPGGTNPRILAAAKEAVLTRTDCIKLMSLYNRLGAESFGEKVKLSWQRVFLSRDEMAATYPASRNSNRLWLYYAMRFKDVVSTYWSHVFNRGE
jgi:hypothetical protein